MLPAKQTVQILIRLLLEEQSDLGLHGFVGHFLIIMWNVDYFYPGIPL